MQHCTMLSPDDVFPWITVLLMTLVMTFLASVLMIYMPKLISRWLHRRDIPVGTEDEDEREESTRFAHTSHSSHSQFMQTECAEEEAKTMSFRDASTQVNDWQSCFE